MSTHFNFPNLQSFFCTYSEEFIIKLELQQKDYKTIDAYKVIVDNFLDYIYNKEPIFEFRELNHRIY